MITREEAALQNSKVFAIVQACPQGRVTTYSWIARAIGYPRGARMVGWIMNQTPAGVPAQRVISSKGELTGSRAFGKPGRMRELLEQEGIAFLADGRVDLKRYGWDPTLDLSSEELQSLLDTSSANLATVSDGLMHLLQNDPASPFRIVPEKE